MFRMKLKFGWARIKDIQHRLKHNWEKPTGYDTNIMMYNTVVKEKVPLIFPNKNYVKWYMCGPTVYDYSHVGHASCYMRLDIIHRILKEYYNIHPVVALGVTDVSEEIIKKAKMQMKPVWEIRTKYSREFFESMNTLNILPPAFTLHVRDHIGHIIEFISVLIRRKIAYIGIDGSVYFSTEADPNYGRFRECPEEEPPALGAGKKDKQDFALWKAAELGYDSPWGPGMPGWHIECSAMASSVFGSQVDLHSGGSDLIFPHHENEEAQSSRYHKCDQWVNYWLHTGLIKVGNEKMSKSLNNFLPTRKFLDIYKSDHLRMFCFMSSYRSDQNVNDHTIELAINICEKISNFLNLTEAYIRGTWKMGNIEEARLLEELDKTQGNVRKHLSNDFGTPEALKEVMSLMKTCTSMLNESSQTTTSRSPGVIAQLRNYVKQFFESAGFIFTKNAEKNYSSSAIDTVVTAAVNARAKVRGIALLMSGKKLRKRESLLALCDEFRQKLSSSGVAINDIGVSESQWSYTPSAEENKILLKEIIDWTVWFRKNVKSHLIDGTVDQTESELDDLCKHIKMYFGILGVDIRDNSNRLEWVFPSPEKENSRLLEGVLLSALQFHGRVRQTAEELDSETKKKLLCYCESIISDLDDLGVGVDQKKQTFEIREEDGMFILNNLTNIVIHLRDQVLVVANNTKDMNLKQFLFKSTVFTKKTLATFGFYVIEANSGLLSSWTVKFSVAHNAALISVVDITVALINNLVNYCKKTSDHIGKDIIQELSKSAIDDLRSIGIVVKNLGKPKATWSFQPSRFQNRYPVSCSPELSVSESAKL